MYILLKASASLLDNSPICKPFQTSFPFAGILSDIPQVKPNHLFTIGMVLSGIASVVCPLLPGNMALLSAYGVIYTIGTATWASLRTVVMGKTIQYWSRDRDSVGFAVSQRDFYLSSFSGVIWDWIHHWWHGNQSNVSRSGGDHWPAHRGISVPSHGFISSYICHVRLCDDNGRHAGRFPPFIGDVGKHQEKQLDMVVG